MTQILSFNSAAGPVNVEIAASDDPDGLGPAAFGRKAAIAAPLTFEQAVAALRPTVQVISDQFRGLADPPGEIEVSPPAPTGTGYLAYLSGKTSGSSKGPTTARVFGRARTSAATVRMSSCVTASIEART